MISIDFDAVDVRALPWSRPFKIRGRCRAQISKEEQPPYGRVYYGRCDLERGHSGPHALERGMDVFLWTTIQRYRMAESGPILRTDPCE